MAGFRKAFFLFFLISLILISGCSKKKDTTISTEEIRTGTDGVVVSFVANNPPQTLVVDESTDNPIKVVLQINNKGAYPQPNEGARGLAPELGRVYLSGYDQDIIDLPVKYSDITQLALEGKSGLNPNGGIDFITFDGSIKPDVLNVEKYEPTLLATVCYGYVTVAGPQVCIDPDPYSTISQKKVCQVQDVQLSSQGAPIAVTSIKEEALLKRTQFRITMKNVGSGDVIKLESFEKCNPFGVEKLAREDIDKIFVEEVKIADTTLQCGPFIDSLSDNTKGYVRLINGEGIITCRLSSDQYATTNTAYTTPLKIKVRYIYKNTAERKLQIKKETSDLKRGSYDGSSI